MSATPKDSTRAAEAVARRRKTHQRTARRERRGPLRSGHLRRVRRAGACGAAAAPRARRSDEKHAADGLVAGIAGSTAICLTNSRAQCVAMSYDYTVLAGTQGQQNHRKKDRMFEIAPGSACPWCSSPRAAAGSRRHRRTVALRLDVPAFHYWGKLSGLVRWSASTRADASRGNAALLGCCDVVIATANSNIGMGGPAMVEGGGLGIFRPEDIGPMSVQIPNGVVDLPVADEAEAVRVAKKYLSYFQGPVGRGSVRPAHFARIIRRIACASTTFARLSRRSPTRLGTRTAAPFGLGMVTALVRVEGRPIGVIATTPRIWPARSTATVPTRAPASCNCCDAFDLPLLFLCDTPGIMVGPENRKDGAGASCRADVSSSGRNISVAVFHYRVAQGLRPGGASDGRGKLQNPDSLPCRGRPASLVGWDWRARPSSAIARNWRRIDDPAARKKLYEEMVARMYQQGKALTAPRISSSTT